MKTETKALFATIITHSIWGVSFLASRVALNTAHVFLLLSHRFLLAFIVMTLVLPFLKERPHYSGKRVFLLLLLGLCEPVIYFFGEQYGILHSNTIFSGVMIAMIPIASTLAAAPILGEKPTAGQLLFSFLSVGGVIGIGLMSRSSGSMDWIGVAGLVIAVVSAAAYTLLSRGISKEFTPFERTYIMLATGAVVFTAFAAVYCSGDIGTYLKPLKETPYLLSVSFLAVFCSVVCYFLSSYAISNLAVARETVFSNLTTVVSVFVGAVFLHETFTWGGAVCCVLILLGIYGVQRTSRKDVRDFEQTAEGAEETAACRR